MRFCDAVEYVTCHPNCAARRFWQDSVPFRLSSVRDD
jgi:hypothetical protein